MKRIFIVVIIFFVSITHAQYKFGSIKLGVFNPVAADAGYMIGYEGGWHMNNDISFGWSADWFHKDYVDGRLVEEYNIFNGTIHSELNEVRAKTNLHSFPIMGSITGSWMIQRRTRVYLTFATGINILLINYRNYENPDRDETQGAIDYAWRLGSGLVYEIAPRADVFGELTFHNSHPSWEYEVSDYSTGRRKIFERSFNMSGLILRIGVKYYF